MIWWLPLEPLEQRYTAQMDRWVQDALVRSSKAFKVVYGDKGYDKIKNGQWLDTVGTAAWKYSQLSRMVEHIRKGEVSQDDVILCGDVWFPGIEGIKQISELMGLRLRFAGWHYAGCFDHFDLLANTLTRWGPKYELSLVEGVYDAIAFGGRFHMNFVLRHACASWQSMPCGLVWNHEEVAAFANDGRKRREVVFNHRWANEKRWQEFCFLSRMMGKKTGYDFIFSTSGNEPPQEIINACGMNGIKIAVHKSKDDYYGWLANAAIVWSGADQETFGYSFMEAVALGCRVVAPNRAAYPDHFVKAGLHASNYLYGADDPCGMVALRKTMHDADNEGMTGMIPAQVSAQYTGSVDAFLEVV